jgi:glycosyltransferase involved in cell wall biosynthesis
VPWALALHDVVDPVSAAPLHDEVVLPASWYADEPTSDVLAAAELLPHVAFAITGRSPAGLAVPANVRLTGFLPRSDYLRLLAGAPVVLALTTRESTMQRAAYEALSAGRPVVASATRALGDYLGEAAVLAGRGGPALAAALTEALERREELAAAAVRVRAVRAAEQEQALARLVGRVSG